MDRAVQEGRITEQQRERILERIQQAGGLGMMGIPREGMRGMRMPHRARVVALNSDFEPHGRVKGPRMRDKGMGQERSMRAPGNSSQ